MTPLISICHKCPSRQQQCAGACACTRTGRDIIEHATAGDCDRFPSPTSVPSPQSSVLTLPLAGDVIAAVAACTGAATAATKIAKLAGKSDCGCKARQSKLNHLDRSIRARLLAWSRRVKRVLRTED